MLKNNGKCYIHLPSYLTVSTLSTDAANAINTVHTALGIPQNTFSAGDSNPYILTLNDLDMGGAPFFRGTGSELAYCGPIDNKSFLNLDYLGLIVAFGGEVEGFPVWFKFQDPDLDTPIYLPNNTIDDERVLFTQWGGREYNSETNENKGIHSVIKKDNYYYTSSLYGNSGTHCLGSEFLGALQDPNVSIITKKEYIQEFSIEE